jgi:simple sugar transport system permease protein
VLRALWPILSALLGSFVIGGVLVLISGENPLPAYGAILQGAVGDSFSLSATLTRALPIVTAGIAAAIAFRAGLINIGTEGQLVLGGLCATLVALGALNSPLPGPLVVALALAAAMLGGGLWALLTGWFETRFNMPILVSSLLLNFVAGGFVSFMINFPLLEVGGARSQTAMIDQAARLPRLVPGTALHAGLIIVAAVVILSAFVLRRTVRGYELRVFGSNREFAVAGGINAVRMTLTTMFASGAIAGLVGAMQVLGVHFRLIDRALTGPGFAWTGIMAAILARNDPLGIVVAGLFFAAVDTGAAGMERATDVPFELSFILQAIIILLIASRAAFQRVASRDDL